MSNEELEYNLKDFAESYKLDLNEIEPIPKNKLIIGEEYCGICRNSSKAIWNGEEFEYKRYKLGSYYTDYINHYEDDDGYDLFVPIRHK